MFGGRPRDVLSGETSDGTNHTNRGPTPPPGGDPVTGLIRTAAAVVLAAAGLAGLLNSPAITGEPGPAAGRQAAGAAVLAPAQIAGVAHQAGFRGDGLVVAVAVALAESGGNPSAHNATPPDDSYGLWQINMLGALGPDRRHRYGLASNQALFDPATNARVVHAIADGGRDWTPWATYTRGTHRRFLDQARHGAGERA